MPIWLLYGTNQLGFSVTLTIALFMTIWLGSALLEIPTGALADRLGRKRMFLIGSALLASYPLVYIAESPPLIIFAVSIVAAFGSALRSGTLIPLTHDSFKKEGRSDTDYHRFLSNEKVLTFIARGASGVLGGLLYAANPHGPYIAMFAVYILLFTAGWFVIDTAASRSTLSQSAHIATTVRAMAQSQPIIMIIACYVGINLVSEAIWTAFQPFFENDGLPVQVIGLIFSGLALVSALGAYSTRFIMQRAGILRIQSLIGLLVAVSASLLLTPWVPVHIAAVVPIAFGFGLTITPFIATVQKYIAKQFHSTALSVVGLLQYGIYGVGSLYVGVLIDQLGIAATQQILCAAAIVVAASIVAYYLLHRQADVIISPKAEAVVEDGAPMAGS